MAKKIKKIICPKCGSNKVTELRPDYYKCNSCGTDFILNDDKINITQNHYNVSASTSTQPAKKYIGIFIGLAIFLAFVFLLPTFITNKTSSFDSGERWNDGDIYFLEDAQKKPVYVIVGEYIGKGQKNEDNQLYIGFYDAVSLKKIKVEMLPLKADRLTVRFRNFSNGQLYFTVNDRYLFTVDKTLLAAKEFPKDKISAVPGLEGGIAKVEYTYDKIDCFKILSNDGIERYYFPQSNQSYISHSAYFDAKRDSTLIPANAPLNTQFMFAKYRASGGMTERCFLVKYQQKYMPGFVHAVAYFKVYEDMSAEEIAASSGPKITVSKYDNAIIPSFKELIPGRQFFDAELLDFNDKYVFIAFKPTAAEDEKYNIQLLDANTGKIIWTTAITDNSKMYFPRSGEITDTGFFVDFGREVTYWDMNGKLVSEASNYTLNKD